MRVGVIKYVVKKNKLKKKGMQQRTKIRRSQFSLSLKNKEALTKKVPI